MKAEIWRSFRLYLCQFLVLLLGLLAANAAGFILLFSPIVQTSHSGYSPHEILAAISQEMETQNSLSSQMESRLTESGIWFQKIEENGSVCISWNTPPEIPTFYSLSDIAVISKGFLSGYPVFMQKARDSLLMVGYPQNSYFKFTSNYLPVHSVRMLPAFVLGSLLLDIFIVFTFFWHSRRKVLQETGPLAEAVEKLTSKEKALLPEEGILKNIAGQINQAADILETQNVARANWIAGISHDIRNPLGIIMASSQQISKDADSANARLYARQITTQASRIKDLISDLNLVSELEYDRQPVMLQEVSLSRLVREACCSILNSADLEKYSLEVLISSGKEPPKLQADSRLLVRALENILNNSIYHNPDGCSIMVRLIQGEDAWEIEITDSGDGCSEAEIQRLNLDNTQRFPVMDSKFQVVHGYGLILVKKIIQMHNGTIVFSNASPKGFRAKIQLPLSIRT